MKVECDDCLEVFEESDLKNGPYDNLICDRCVIKVDVEHIIEELLTNVNADTMNKAHAEIMKLIDTGVKPCDNVKNQQPGGHNG